MTSTNLPVATQLQSLKAMLEHKQADLMRVAAQGLDMRKLIPIVISRVARRPELLECTPDSFYSALHLAAQIGLEPEGPHGHFYLIPRANKHRGGAKEAIPLIGYKGLCELARRSGQITRLDAHLIYEGETFAYDRGTGAISHPYRMDVDRTDAKIVGAYATAHLKDCAQPIVCVLTRAEIDARRRRSLARDGGPWVTDYAAMVRKTALRALLNGGLVPLTRELATAVEAEIEEELKLADVEVLAEPVESKSAAKRLGQRLGETAAREPGDDADIPDSNKGEVGP